MKKILALFLVSAMLLSISACKSTSFSSDNTASKTSDTSSGTSTQAKPPQTRIITDVWNRKVEIPYKVESIVCLGSMGPRLAAYLNVVDMMAGAEDIDIEKENVRFDYSPVYHEKLKLLPSVGSGGGSGENNGYPEQLIEVMPDVIIAGFSAEASEELQQQTGIPVISIRYRAQAFIDEGFYKAIRLFAEVVGAEKRCEELLSYIDKCKADLDDRTNEIEASQKKSVYTGAVTFNGRHGFGFTYVNFPAFLAVKANNVADVFLEKVTGEAASEASKSGTAYVGQNGFEVDLEQIIEWNPDVIFLDPGNMDLVNDEYKSNPSFFNSLRAIRDGEVYTMPSTNSAGPNITYLLINAYYAGVVLYPERFKDIDIAQKAGEIMEVMLGENFFDKMEAEGLYYGKITIGK